MRRATILSLNRPTAKKIGYSTTPTQNPAKAVDDIVRQEHKKLHGMQMEHHFLENL